MKHDLREEEVSRILKIEIPHWQNGGTNFTSVLLGLISKSDIVNTHKLARIYPAEVEAIKRWSVREQE